MKRLTSLALCALLLSCNNSEQTISEKQDMVENGTLNDNYQFEAKEVGWTTSIPKNWNLLTKEEADRLNKKGMEAIEATTGSKIEIGDLRELINLKKDAYNSFLSTIQSYDEKRDGPYDQKNTDMIKMIRDTYTAKGIKHDITTSTTEVGGLEFLKVTVRIFKPASEEVLMWQEMYSRLIRNFDFSMTVNYNNPSDKVILDKIIMDSRFR